MTRDFDEDDALASFLLGAALPKRPTSPSSLSPMATDSSSDDFVAPPDVTFVPPDSVPPPPPQESASTSRYSTQSSPLRRSVLLSPRIRSDSDRALLMEFQLLDVLDKPPLESDMPRKMHSLSTCSLPVLSTCQATEPKSARNETADDLLLIEQPTNFPNSTMVNEAASPPPPPKKARRCCTLLPKDPVPRKRVIYAIALVLFLVIVGLCVGLFFALTDRCEQFGCTRNNLYILLKASLSVSRDNGTDFQLSAAALSTFPHLTALTKYLISTYPSDLHMPFKTDAIIFRNMSSPEVVNKTTPYLTPVTTIFAPNIDGQPTTFSLGDPICGRLAADTPIFGFLPSPFAQNAVFKGYDVHGIEISNFTDTSMDANEDRDYYAKMIEKNTFKEQDLVVCCIEFVYQTSQMSVLVKPRDVHARVICQSSVGIGGSWNGWDTLISVPEDSWTAKVRTGGYLQYSPTLSMVDSSTTAIGISTVADNSWPVGIVLVTKASFPLNTFEVLPNVLRMGLSPLLESNMAVLLPFRHGSMSLDLSEAYFNFAISTDNIDTSSIVPSPWLYTGGMQFILNTPFQVTDAKAMRVALGNQWIEFSGGCPVGYAKIATGCWKTGYQMKVDYSMTEDNTFVDPADHKFKSAIIIRYEFSITSSEERASDRSSQSQAIPVSFQVRQYDINGTIWSLGNPIGRFYLMQDGDTYDNTLDAQANFQSNVIYDTQNFKLEGIDYLRGGSWIEIQWKNGIPELSPWFEIPALALKTSRRSNSLTLAFVPSADFQRQSLDLHLHLFAPQLSPQIFKPLEFTLSPKKMKPWSWVNPLRSHALLHSLVLKSIDVLSGSKVAVPDQSPKARATIESNGSTSTHSVLLDSAIFSGVGVPSRDSLDNSFCQWPSSMRSLSIFQLPVTSHDMQPQTSFDIWGKKRDRTINDTLDFQSYQEKMQPALAFIRQKLQVVYTTIPLPATEHILELSIHVRNRILASAGKFDTKRLRKQLEALAHPFFNEINQYLVEGLPAFLTFMRQWITSDVSMNSADIPSPILDAFHSINSYGESKSLYYFLGKQPTALDVILLFASIETSFFSGKSFYKVDSKNVTDSDAIDALIPEDYINKLRFKVKLRPTQSKSDTFCFDSKCGNSTEIRPAFIKENIRQLQKVATILNEYPHPPTFPSEVFLPIAFGKTSRRDIHFVTNFLEEWTAVKLDNRNRWMTWAALKTAKFLSNTLMEEFDELVGFNYPDNIKVDLIPWTPVMISMANMQFLPPSQNWTLLTWPEQSAIEIMQLVLDPSASDDQLIDMLVAFASYSQAS